MPAYILMIFLPDTQSGAEHHMHIKQWMWMLSILWPIICRKQSWILDMTSNRGWSLASTSAELSWNSNVTSPIFFITSKVPPFSSPQHKQKAWQQYQLYMQEANKGIYFTTNSLIETRWIGQISIRKEQQNSSVQRLKSNWMGLELGKLLD